MNKNLIQVLAILLLVTLCFADQSYNAKEVIGVSNNDKVDIKLKNLFNAVPQHLEVTTSALSFDGNIVVSGGSDGVIKVWSINENRQIYEYKAHPDKVLRVSISRDNKYIASTSLNSNTKIFDFQTKQEYLNLQQNTYSRGLAFTYDNKYFLQVTYDGLINIYSIATKTLVKSFSNEGNPATCIAVSQTPRYFATGHRYGQVQVWDLEKMQSIRQSSYPFDPKNTINPVNKVKVTWDNKHILALFEQGEQILYDFETLKYTLTPRKYPYDKIFTVNAITPDNRYFIGDQKGHLVIDDRKDVNNRQLFIFKQAHRGYDIRSIDVSRDGKYIVTSGDQFVKVWELIRYREQKVLELSSTSILEKLERLEEDLDLMIEQLI